MWDFLLTQGMGLYAQWLMNWPRSTWSIKTSAGGEIDVTVFAGSAGTFYVADSTDPQCALHQVQYTGLGLTWSKGPFPGALGGSYSTADMPGGGWGSIAMKPGMSSLSLSDFAGSGCIFSGSLNLAAVGAGPSGKDMPIGSALEGSAITLVFFGAPPLLTVAIGVAVGKQKMLPGIGATWLPCVFRTIVGEPGSAKG
jgi:hypothetical protein